MSARRVIMRRVSGEPAEIRRHCTKCLALRGIDHDYLQAQRTLRRTYPITCAGSSRENKNRLHGIKHRLSAFRQNRQGNVS